MLSVSTSLSNLNGEIKLLEGASQAEPTEKQPVTTSDRETLRLSEELGERASKIKSRKDLLKVLELMKNGVIVKLRIEMPSFQARLDDKYLGLEHQAEARQVLHHYIQLGKLILLPKELHNRLVVTVSKARKNLYRFSFDSYWGQFVPVHNYKVWKEANASFEAEFEAIKAEILATYSTLVEEVLEIYWPLAASNWRQHLIRSLAALREEHPEGIPAGKLDKMQAGKEAFIEQYLTRVKQAMPDLSTLENEFLYEVRLERVPLPSELARDQEAADSLFKERALKDAQHRAELDRIEDQSRAEREKYYLQSQIERDLAESTRSQARQLADEFFNGIVGQVNTLISEVSTNVLDSIERNEGKLVGRSSVQLRNLLDELAGYRDYLSDEKLSQQIERIRAALPERNSDTKGSEVKRLKLDTNPLQRALREVGREAEETLLELEQTASPRMATRKPGATLGGETPLELLDPETGLETYPARKGRRKIGRNDQGVSHDLLDLL